jgi:hypothetical protein
MQVKLDDDLMAVYAHWADESKQPLAALLERQLARFQDYPPTLRVLPLGRGPLQQIESLLGGGQITSPENLVDRVRSYASITLGKVTLDLSQAQKAELTYRAQKRGVPPDVIVKEIIDLLLDQMFDAVTPYR